MFHKLFKISPFVILTLLNVQTLSAHAAGGVSGGGGDASESRVNDIRADIMKWIGAGGAQSLHLPNGTSLDTYQREMTKVLLPQAVVVGFVTSAQESATSDPEQKVIVDGQPKTCRGFVSQKDQLPHILCNTERFASTSEAGQYRLVHHEYAGLAGVEQNIGAASDYAVSDQLTDYLVPETILKLAVKNGAGRSKDGIRGVFGFYKLVSDLGGDIPCKSDEVILTFDTGHHSSVTIADSYFDTEVDKSFWQGFMDRSGSVGRKTTAYAYSQTSSAFLLTVDAQALWNSGSDDFTRSFYKTYITAKSSVRCILNKKTGLMALSETLTEFDYKHNTSSVKTRSCLMEFVQSQDTK